VLQREIAGCDVIDRHSGTTGRARLVARDAAGSATPLFVKLAPFDARQRAFVDAVGLGIAEARFYRDLAIAVPVRVPRVMHAALDDDGRYVMVLEDLVASGCRFPNPNDTDVVPTVTSLVDEFARLHAAYWEDPRLDGELHWLGLGLRQEFGRGGPFIARAIDRFAGDMPTAFRHLGDLYVSHTAAIAEMFAQGPQTLVHGDPHFGNLFVDRGRAGFFDWAMVMRRTAMWDVAYTLCNSVPTDVRRAYEHAWLEQYQRELTNNGVTIAGATLWDQYRLFAVYSWASATSTAGAGSRWQSEEVGVGAMMRATAAIEDLASIDVLEAAL
jgi:hypothetical protein